jgi:phosphatidate cytidylyltransferase
LSGLFLIPIAIYVVLYIPIFWFTILTFAITLYGLWEYNNVVSSGVRANFFGSKLGPNIIWALPGVTLPVSAYFFGLVSVLPCLVLVVISYFIICVLVGYRDNVIKVVWVRFFGVIYVALLFSHFISLRQIPHGNKWLLFALAIVWAGDTGAYYGGRAFGKKKLSPVISPNKTVEGAIAGLVASMCAGLILVRLFGLNADISIILTLLLSLIAGVAGIFGDLTESYIKRWAGVKDSGRLIPGHGGLLDRVDSVLFSVPVVFYLLYIFGV